MNGALIAHDNMKDDMVLFAQKHREILSQFTLYATGTTGQRLIDETGLPVHRLQSGPPADWSAHCSGTDSFCHLPERPTDRTAS